MIRIFSVTMSLVLVASAASAGDHGHVVGEYVEARTAEVFAGGCIMNSEAETAGRQAVMAWRITRGIYNGVTLDGLSIAAAVAGDRNLGMREMGGEAPQDVRAILTVDQRATEAQRDALVQLARELAGGLITDVVRVDSAPVRFDETDTHHRSERQRCVDLEREQSDDARPELRRDAVVQAVLTAVDLVCNGYCRSAYVFGCRSRQQVERSPQALRLLGNVLVLIVHALVVGPARGCPRAAQPAATPLAAPAPDTVAAPIRQQLSPEGHKVSIGQTTLEFWWVSALPVAGGGAAEWSKVAEGSLVGVVRVSGPFKEIRGKPVSPGVYTLRFGLQPQNGDHLGASAFREYLLLSPASGGPGPQGPRI